MHNATKRGMYHYLFSDSSFQPPLLIPCSVSCGKGSIVLLPQEQLSSFKSEQFALCTHKMHEIRSPCCPPSLAYTVNLMLCQFLLVWLYLTTSSRQSLRYEACSLFYSLMKSCNPCSNKHAATVPPTLNYPFLFYRPSTNLVF